MTCRVIKVDELNRLKEKESFAEDIFILLDGEMSKKEEIEILLRELSIRYKICPIVHTNASIAKQIQNKIHLSQKYVFVSFDDTSHIHDEDCVRSVLSLHHTPILLDIKTYPDKEELLRKLKKTVLTTFCLYFGLLLISILSGTSSLTYEYADANKLGYRGWFDSGQILGHAFSIIFPSLIYIVLSPKRKWYYRIIIITKY